MICADEARSCHLAGASPMRRAIPIVSWCLSIALIVTLGGCGFESSSDSESSRTQGFILGESRVGIDRLGPPQMINANDQTTSDEETSGVSSGDGEDETPGSTQR